MCYQMKCTLGCGCGGLLKLGSDSGSLCVVLYADWILMLGIVQG